MTDQQPPRTILDDVLIFLAGQKFPTPEKGFTCWEDAYASLKRFGRERRDPTPAGDAVCEWRLREADLHWNDAHYHTTCSRTWAYELVQGKIPFMKWCGFCGKPLVERTSDD